MVKWGFNILDSSDDKKGARKNMGSFSKKQSDWSKYNKGFTNKFGGPSNKMGWNNQQRRSNFAYHYWSGRTKLFKSGWGFLVSACFGIIRCSAGLKLHLALPVCRSCAFRPFYIAAVSWDFTANPWTKQDKKLAPVSPWILHCTGHFEIQPAGSSENTVIDWKIPLVSIDFTWFYHKFTNPHGCSAVLHPPSLCFKSLPTSTQPPWHLVGT